MPRGTGEVSLKDFHKIEEIVTAKTKVKLNDDDMKWFVLAPSSGEDYSETGQYEMMNVYFSAI